MSDSSIVVISLSPTTVTSSSAIDPNTSYTIKLYSTTSYYYYSSSSSSFPDPFQKRISESYPDSPPCVVRVPHCYHIMSDDDVSAADEPLANVPEAHPSTDEVVDEIIIAPFPGVSYGVPLDEISTAPENSIVVVKTIDEIPDEETLPSEPVQEIGLSDANLSLEDIAASLLDSNIKLDLSKEEEDIITDTLVNIKDRSC